jgi:hypothetical protein
MNFDNTLFRCSSIGHLMTDPRAAADKKAGNLSEGAKTHLVDVYVSAKYGRNTDIQNKYISKGLMVEEDSITLYSRVKKNYFKKNEEHLFNSFIKGTPDMFTGTDIRMADTVVDVKSSWDIFTFFRVHTKDINPLYWYQLQGYMALTGAASAKLAYCLIDTPDQLIIDEKRKLIYKMGCATEESPEFVEACAEMDKLMTYGDIPMNERVIEFEIIRDQEEIDRMYDRVQKARIFLKELEESLSPSVLLAQHDPEVSATIINPLLQNLS